MRYLVSAEEMRRYDANTIGELGIPGMVLMERAALAARDYILKKGKDAARRVLVMAGTGNNGGDGLALARLLSEAGLSVDVWRVGDENRASGQWRQQRDILEHYDVKVSDNLPDREYTILVDALFGVGLAREVAGEHAEAIAAFDRKDGFKLALDVPSGIDSDTGRVLGCAVRADATVTFGFAKRGLYLYPGSSFAGEIQIAEIGITEKSFLGKKPEMFCQTLEDIRPNMPYRDAAGNKGTFGKVLFIAGEAGMAGAAVLAARAAYRVGAGMVKVLTAPENRVILQETVPEALYGTLEQLEESLGWADVAAIGPGLGRGAGAQRALEKVIRQSGLPLLIDADGLNLLAQAPALQQELSAQDREVVLTPHVGELARLLGRSVPELKDGRLWVHGMALAERLHAVVVAKDARTFICREGCPLCMNILGNNGMATAGSGDVLAGVIAGLLGQFEKQQPAEGHNRTRTRGQMAGRAARLGVLLHGAAGDLAAAGKGENACMAGDLVEALAGVIRRGNAGCDRDGKIAEPV